MSNSTDWPKVRARKDGRYSIDCGVIDGKRVMLTRNTLKDAELEAERIRTREKKIGRDAARLSQERMRDAVLAYEKLQGTGYTLCHAVNFLLENRAGEGGEITVRNLYEAYYQDRLDNHRSPETMRDIRCRLGKFANDFEEAPAHHITKRTLQDWLRTQNGGPVSKANIRRHLSGLFNFALERDHAVSNPAATLTTPKVRKDRRPPILSVDAARNLMNTAASQEPDMVPWFVLALFCGIRPAEIERMDWAEVDWRTHDVFIGGEVSKTGNERYVALQSNALEWLLPFRQKSGPIHFSRRQYRRVRELSKVKWGHDILRHTYGSMHLAAFRNSGDTAENMGHESSTKMLFKHYRRAVPEEEAEKFWLISPEIHTRVIALGAS
jgi:integrase